MDELPDLHGNAAGPLEGAEGLAGVLAWSGRVAARSLVRRGGQLGCPPVTAQVPVSADLPSWGCQLLGGVHAMLGQVTAGRRVEVFPVEPDCWIAVIPARAGAFSTETDSPNDVHRAVRLAIQGVLEEPDPAFHLVDDLGRPWTLGSAQEQLTRLDIQFRAERSSWLRRLFIRGAPHSGDCPACHHDWREHIPADGECSECKYEIEHGETGAPSVPCRRMSAPHPRP